jgi:hypothetical protein
VPLTGIACIEHWVSLLARASTCQPLATDVYNVPEIGRLLVRFQSGEPLALGKKAFCGRLCCKEPTSIVLSPPHFARRPGDACPVNWFEIFRNAT